MSKNDNIPPIDNRKPINEEVRGGYNPPSSEQRPNPPAKPPEKPKKD